MNVIFLGPPGAGKGTVAAEIKERFNLEHLSTGDMLRAEMKAGSELGKMAKSYIDAGSLVPDDVIIGMVGERLKAAKGGILFDGFPRTVAQAEALGRIAQIDRVVNLDTTVDVVVGRICSRRLCRECGAVYSVKSLAGAEACPKCGGEIYIRDDDTEETVRERFHVYEQQTASLIDFYAAQGIVSNIDADDTIENVVQQIVTALS